ncbi:Protein disulfide-isomerase 5-4 [Acorus gramineus]|uniref:Protein disulfide-isomerase 5-4 n=1 Tax=Acorus gramineus TaxID=55184 RepID=A0AAV9BST8_ACOGR|nr:Protein disulfide-isomerase 5-4 [Acorus gramineus]
MGVSSSKIEEDKALTLCRERKRFVRQALDGRCSLAAAHVSYIQSLKNTGTALRKFVEPEVPVESSLYTSTSVTPEPVASTDKSLSQFSFSSPSRSQRIESNETISQSTSPTHSGRFHVNYMRSGGGFYTVEERPPTSLTATVQSSEMPPSPRTPPPPENSPWDYFSLFDNQFSFTDSRGVSHHGLENVDDIGRLREEEGIPELEEERDNHSVNGRAEFKDSEDDFDEPSPKPLVQKYENQAASINSLNDVTSPVSSMASIAQDTPHLNGEKKIPESGLYETDETPDTTSPNATPPIVTPPIDDMKEIENVSVSEKKIVPKDFLSSVKATEYLFVKSSESGKEFMRMLEANKVFFRPLHPEKKEPPSDTVKYLTWHRSASSLSSTSRIPMSSTPNDDLEDISHNMFSTSCMKSGSHASTLERLYAWERKLYDEVKFDVTFPSLACSLLSVDSMDISGEQHYDIKHDIIKKRIDPHGNVIESRQEGIGAPKIERPLQRHGGRLDHNETYCGSCFGAEMCEREGFIQKIKEEEGEGCNIHGFLEVNKVAGNFHFSPGKSFHMSNINIDDLIDLPSEKHNISHKINKLSFGKDFPGVVNPLDGVEWTHKASSPGQYQYFIKVVPTIYTDKRGRKIHSNQFSVTEHFRDADGYPRPLPGVFFVYDFNPIKVTLTEDHVPLLHFLTNICAIVGGVFTVAGIVDALVYHGHRAIKKKVDLGKYT